MYVVRMYTRIPCTHKKKTIQWPYSYWSFPPLSMLQIIHLICKLRCWGTTVRRSNRMNHHKLRSNSMNERVPPPITSFVNGIHSYWKMISFLIFQIIHTTAHHMNFHLICLIQLPPTRLCWQKWSLIDRGSITDKLIQP